MIVMDTCAILWDTLDPGRLSAKAKRAINKADENHSLLISDISLWEISMLIKRKRVGIDEAPASFLRLMLDSRNYQVIAISPDIAELSVNLGERVNGDPADRFIVATAIARQAALVTADRNLREAGALEVIW
jgi:PIN domain nuclease of toxin-antitoxin system